ncbi:MULTISPECIES: AAA family ATPase [Chryseobacterium]|nr:MULTISPECIES: AAA family ATPase [Chryseobacterium]
MTIQEFLIPYNKSFQEITEQYSDIFIKVYNNEQEKNWLVPIESKLDKFSDNKNQEDFRYVIDILKSENEFTQDDISKLSTFVSKVNLVVKVADRINNFKQATPLEDGSQLQLVNLFNTIKSTSSLKNFKFTLNRNLNNFRAHIFSVIKHCQSPDLYPVYYPFWQKVSKHILKIENDYDSICEFYRTFPEENRTLNFGSYYGTLIKVIINNVNSIYDEVSKKTIVDFLKKEVINLSEYQNLLDDVLKPISNNNKKYWIYSPGEKAYKWDEFYSEQIMALGWDDIGDLMQYQTKNDIQAKLLSTYESNTNRNNDAIANFEFANSINIGDIIIVKKGRYELLGFGEVMSDYYFDDNRDDYKHCRRVQWKLSGNWNVDHTLVMKTLTDITTYASGLNDGKKYYEHLLSIMENTTIQVQDNPIVNLLKYKKQIILQGPPGTGKTREAKRIAQNILGLDEKELQDSEQFKIIQFHPSYTYEDFVRGIVAESNGDRIEYKNINKTLGKFAKVAKENFDNHHKELKDYSREVQAKEYFEKFIEYVQDLIEEKNGYYELTENVGLISTDDEEAFRYKGKNEGWLKNGNRMLYKDILRAFLDNNTERQDVKKNINISGLARQHASYFVRVLNLFQNFLNEHHYTFSEVNIGKEPLKKYILVIDEINRANLSSVLGELIYALEYRGEEVDSMYEVDGSQKLVLPPNLYIIGTMNTADRSVGHIDYAIRRRFAFVDVLPEKLEDTEDVFFNTPGFVEVAKLFIKVGEDEVINFENAEDSDFLSNDFSSKDVALGHSYFIADRKKISKEEKDNYFKMKMKYEVIPILNEYLRDGVFNESATAKIKDIEQRFA